MVASIASAEIYFKHKVFKAPSHIRALTFPPSRAHCYASVKRMAARGGRRCSNIMSSIGTTPTPMAPTSPVASAGPRHGWSRRRPFATRSRRRAGQGSTLPMATRPATASTCSCRRATPRGLVVFVHGGYWMALDKSFWSHLAAGSVANGYAVAMPSYTLCPEVRIADIVKEIGAAIGAAAAMVEGPDHADGHSAGGHLVSRMIAEASPLAPELLDRIRNVVSISGVHDLRPLMRTGDERDARGSTRPRRWPRARHCCARSPTPASPAGSAAANAPNSCARTRCSPISGPASAPPRMRWWSRTGIISASSTGWPIRPIR